MTIEPFERADNHDGSGATTEALRASERRYLELLETAPVGVFLVDLELTVIHANKTAAEIIGAPNQSLVGLRLGDSTFSETEAYEQLKSVCSSGEPVVGEASLTTRFGKELIARGHFAPALCDKGEIIGALGVFEDITEQKLAEEAVKHAQKLESLCVVAAGPSAQFQQPSPSHHRQCGTGNTLDRRRFACTIQPNQYSKRCVPGK